MTNAQKETRIAQTLIPAIPMFTSVFNWYRTEGRLVHTPFMFSQSGAPVDTPKVPTAMDLNWKQGNQISWQEVIDASGQQAFFDTLTFISNVKLQCYGPVRDYGVAYALEIQYWDTEDPNNHRIRHTHKVKGPDYYDYLKHPFQYLETV